MGSFVPSTREERQAMLAAVGLRKAEELYGAVPESIRLSEGGLGLEEGLSEMEAAEKMEALAEKNRVFHTVFRGAGSYDHYIPAIVRRVTGKEEFLTAYTPYQAEISQGILQSIFEYQTMICALTGMDAANASVYDGATAAAEAAAMCRDAKRRRVLISGGVHPQTAETVETYAWGALPMAEAAAGEKGRVAVLPLKDGRTDPADLAAALDDETACVLIQQPNFYGVLEDVEALAAAAHARKAKLIVSVNPIAAAVLKSAGACGADIAVGEGQPLGMEMGFGGPYLGFMAAKKEMMRRLPGRIVGQTEDSRGQRCFVLTLQAREQHIRREKASSNICSNEALCAMTAAAYLAAMGPDGMTETAMNCAANAHELQRRLAEIGYPPVFKSEFFHEFLTPAIGPETAARLETEGILPGLPLGENMLWCCTEKCGREKIDRLIALIREVEGR